MYLVWVGERQIKCVIYRVIRDDGRMMYTYVFSLGIYTTCFWPNTGVNTVVRVDAIFSLFSATA